MAEAFAAHPRSWVQSLDHYKKKKCVLAPVSFPWVLGEPSWRLPNDHSPGPAVRELPNMNPSLILGRTDISLQSKHSTLL